MQIQIQIQIQMQIQMQMQMQTEKQTQIKVALAHKDDSAANLHFATLSPAPLYLCKRSILEKV